MDSGGMNDRREARSAVLSSIQTRMFRPTISFTD
jgi:hypothetical protein